MEAKKEAGDTRTIADLAREALDVQNACNLSGVAQGFARSILRLRRLLDESGQGGTDATNHHPIARLWADKIASLCGTQMSVSWVPDAFGTVERLATTDREVSRAG